MSVALASTSSVPAQRPIRATCNRSGATVMLVPSLSREGLYHVTTVTACDCAGYRWRGTCSHLATVQRELGLQDGGAAHLAVMRAAGDWLRVSPEVAAKAATYHSIFGNDD